jgi:hypothetical protein
MRPLSVGDDGSKAVEGVLGYLGTATSVSGDSYLNQAILALVGVA